MPNQKVFSDNCVLDELHDSNDNDQDTSFDDQEHSSDAASNDDDSDQSFTSNDSLTKASRERPLALANNRISKGK